MGVVWQVWVSLGVGNLLSGLKIYTTCTPTRLPLKLRHTPWHSARHYFLISYICQQSPDTSQYILLVAE